MSLASDHPEELLPWYVNGTLGPQELQRVEAHLDQCPSCREEVQALRALRREIKDVAEPSEEDLPGEAGIQRLLSAIENEPEQIRPRPVRPELASGRRFWGGSRTAWQLAAVLVLAVGLGSLVFRSPDPPQVVHRAGEQTRGIQSLIPPGEALHPESFLLRWSSPEGAPAPVYSVRVSTTDLESLHQAENLTEEVYQVPKEVFSELPVGARLLWRVEAVSADGEREVSATFHVTLAEAGAASGEEKP